MIEPEKLGIHPLGLHPALDALGEPMRRRILGLLRPGARSVTEISNQLPVSRPAVSQHLAKLLAAGLVTCRVSGREHLYELHSDGFDSVRAYVDGFWGSALARFRLVAENTTP